MTRIGAVFTTPWPLRVNPHLDQARESALDWMRRFGLLDGEQAEKEFVDWRLAEVAAFFYPAASAEECCAAAQMMGWYFLPFDDQLDGEIGRRPGTVAAVCNALIGIVHGVSGPEAHDTPTVRAFADLWSRMVRGMSPTLRTRLAYHWAAYFSSQVTEAIDRTTGFAHRDLADYFSLRAATTCAFGQNDLGEQWGGTEVPPELWHHPVLRRMRQLGADVVALRNDSMSLRHEDVTSGLNAIHLIQRTRGCTRQQALAEASRHAQAKVDELVELEERALSRLIRAVDPDRGAALLGYAEIIHDWIRGDYEWERITTRHDRHRVMPDWASGLLVGAGS
ncbi:hypothetical protein ABT104_12750 [Streptomyces mobaraensis]|uniref:terpene synthase family protein n=1 Tax=Streptomyces mobaraensis TaxID=35621 RepID=UPI003334A194